MMERLWQMVNLSLQTTASWDGRCGVPVSPPSTCESVGKLLNSTETEPPYLLNGANNQCPHKTIVKTERNMNVNMLCKL